MKSERYKYQRYLSAIFVIDIFIAVIGIVLFSDLFFFDPLIKEAFVDDFLFLWILIGLYSIALFKKYNFRFKTLVTFDTDKISVINGRKSETIKVDKNLEIWVLSSNDDSYQQYFPDLKLRNNNLIVIGNPEKFKDKKIIRTGKTKLYDSDMQHLEKPFGRGYVSITYRRSLSEWLNLYNKQIHRDRFPVSSFKYLKKHNKLSEVSLHH